MTDKEKTSSPGRREFLKAASLGTLGGAALLAAGTRETAAEVGKETGSGYRETPHVKTVYELSRF